MRAVRDEDVDRAQVYRRRRHSRALLIARKLPRIESRHCRAKLLPESSPLVAAWRTRRKTQGSCCPGAPPLPIPNREAKPGRADGTAQAGEQGAAAFEGAPTDRQVGAPSFFDLLVGRDGGALPVM